MTKIILLIFIFIVCRDYSNDAFGASVSLSGTSVVQGGNLTVYWSGFESNVNLKFYKGSTFIDYASTNVAGSGNQILTMTDYEVSARLRISKVL
jgi:hypothetical protein